MFVKISGATIARLTPLWLRAWSRLHTTLVQITRITPSEYTLNVLYWKYFNCSGFLSNLRMPSKTEFSRKIYNVLNIFLTIQDFWATLRLPWKTEFALKFFTIFNILFIFRIFKQLALALNSLYGIYIFYSGVRWGAWLGGIVSFKAKFASVWIKWSSINSPLNWLLAEWLLLMLSIPYHNLLRTYTGRHNGDSRFEKK